MMSKELCAYVEWQPFKRVPAHRFVISSLQWYKVGVKEFWNTLSKLAFEGMEREAS